MFINPWGEVLQQGPIEKEETLTETLNLEKVLQVRKEVPVFDSRVPHLY